LLDKLCEGSFDLTDTLFNELEKGLIPALSHRLLAFLQPKLGMPLVLTTNFDSLLERAFREERLRPKVFDVHRDADLPSPELVRNQLSILKLHGSAYGLRFGERLKQQLETNTRSDALQYLPKNALILVIGFSGSERRMMQMLQAFVQKDTTTCLPKLIWIQGPSDPGPLFDELINATEDGVKWCKVRHADTFLQGLYFKIANSHQSTRKQYSSLPGQLRMADVEPKLPEKNDDTNELKRRSVQCFFADFKEDLSGSWATLAGVAFTNSLDFSYKVIWIDLEYYQTTEGIIAEFFNQVRIIDPQAPSYNISNLSSYKIEEVQAAVHDILKEFQRNEANRLKESLKFIRNNFESESAIQKILDIVQSKPPKQCNILEKINTAFTALQEASQNKKSENIIKAFDLINDVFQNKNTKAIEKAIERIHEVFQRGRYVLVLDSLESFGRPPLIHHGISSIRDVAPNDENHLFTDFEKQTNTFYIFLEKLLFIDSKEESVKMEWDYYIVVTIEKPHSRHGNEIDTIELIQKNIEVFKKKLNNNKSRIRLLQQPDNIHYKEFYEDNTSVHPPTAKLEKYWQFNDNVKLNTDSRHIERANSITSLLKELRPKIFEYSSDIEQPEKKFISAFISLLSFFRRPRTIPMLRSITTRWALRNIGSHEKEGADGEKTDEQVSDYAHKKVLNLLEEITLKKTDIGAEHVFSQRHEGGSIWLYREIHENSYDSLTEYLHIQKWVDTWDRNSKNGYKEQEKSIAEVAAIMDGMVFISWHLSIARTYYVDVFMPTQDIKAFYEYLYHRITAIRTIVLLINITNSFNDGPESSWVLLKEEFDVLDIKSNGEQPNTFSLYANLVGLFSQIPNYEENLDNPTKREFINKLQKLHVNSLETLLTALERNELLFLAQSTPDAVLSWSKQFLNHEFPLMGRNEDKNEKILGKNNPDAVKIINSLEEFFLRLQFKAKMSKFDFKGIYSSESADCGVDRPINQYDKKKLIEHCDNKLSSLKKEIESPDESGHKENIQEQVDDLQKYIGKFLRKARCSIYFDFDFSHDLAKAIQKNSDLKTYPNIVSLHRDAIALKGKAHIAQWPFWNPLLDRENLSPASKERLKAITGFSIEYEDTLRITTKTKSEDALHRSSSFALRARSLYLQGHFSEAHHFLDIGSTGLLLERVDHKTNACIIHLVRAELLAMSADKHYPLDKEPQKEEISIVDKLTVAANTSLKKINRAEQELYQAEEILHDIAHEKMWQILVEFGWAQIKLERMLFEMELLFLESQELNESEYLKKSGALEQLILETMQRLRNVLDMIPYSSNEWETEKEIIDRPIKNNINKPQNIDEKDESYYPTLVKIERMSYKLWKQLFIAGAYYTGLLSEQYKNFNNQNYRLYPNSILVAISRLNGIATTGSDAQPYQERWKLWCTAMRFTKLGKAVKLSISLAPNEDSFLTNSKKHSLRATVIESMKNECDFEKINKMWNDRRETF
jgi:hypothetical protein